MVTDLVVLSLEPWDEVWRRNQHLVAGLLGRDPGLRVLFVEPPVDPLHDVATGHRPRRGHGVRPVALSGAEGRLWTFRPTKILPRRLDPGADRRLAAATVRAARRLGFAVPVCWINDPSAAELLRVTDWPALYDITDDWLEADRTPAAHARLVRDEALLLARCAEVVVCSPTLAAAKGAVRPVTLIPNAVDVDLYRRPQPRPADLPSGPVAVYVGTVHTDRIDLDLCVATARELGPAGTLVLVGPHPLAAADLERLRHAGVLLVGPKPAAEVPGYLQHADVLVVPHVVTPFTLSLDPIKRYEYAAVGRPVVSTPVTGFVEGDPRVTVASGDAFAAAVRTAVPAASAFPAGADGPVPSWTERSAEMAEVIERVRRGATPR
nr:glycosyltransferase family 1 protein [Propionibacterium sp.]